MTHLNLQMCKTSDSMFVISKTGITYFIWRLSNIYVLNLQINLSITFGKLSDCILLSALNSFAIN